MTIPDSSLEPEQSVIGMALLDPSKITLMIEIPGDHFYHNANKAVHKAVQELFSANLTVDLWSLSEHLERTQKALGVEWQTYLFECMDNVGTSSAFESYVRSLAEHTKRRNIQATINDVGMQLANGATVDSVLEYMQDAVVNMASKSTGESFTGFKDVLAQGVAEVERRQAMDGVPDGQVTHYPMLDDVLDGFQDELVYVVAGRTSMGKSAFTLQLVYRLADKRPWLIFSLEMSKKSIGMRAIANAANIFGGKLKGRPKLDQADFDGMVPAVGAWMDKPIYVDQTPGLAVAQVRARAKVQELKLGPLGGIVIDHAGLLKKHKGMSSTESATENSHALQALAKEMHCPLIEVVQINRGAEGSNDKRPGLSDLKQTGAWEEDADVAILLYRDEYYNPNTQYVGVTEANIAKNRDGETKTIGYNHVLATGRYTEFGEFQPEQKKSKVSGADL